MSMNTLKKNLKKDFSQNYRELGELVMLEFRSKNPRKKLLFVASDHGDEVSGTDTLLKKARQLKNKLNIFTDIDLIPVIDINGYPHNKTNLDEGAFGKKNYLDSSYFLESPPEYIRKLQAIIETGKYDLVCMLNSKFQEETTLLNGFFIEPQIDFHKGGIFTFPEASDLIGCISYTVAQKNKILTAHKQGKLGGGYFLLRPGVVLPGRKEGKKIVPKTMLGLNKFSQSIGVHALALTTLSSRLDEGIQKESRNTHEDAFEAVVKFYKELKI